MELDVKNNPSPVMPSAGEEHNMPLPKEQPLEMFAGESETAYNQKLNQNHLNRSSFNWMESAVVGFIRNRYDRKLNIFLVRSQKHASCVSSAK